MSFQERKALMNCWNPKKREFLNDNRSSRVLQLEEWAQCYRSEHVRVLFTMELLNAFDPQVNGPTLVDPLTANLASACEPEARGLFIITFLKFARVCGTLCGCMGSNEFVQFSPGSAATIMNHYTQADWGKAKIFKESEL